VSLYYSINAFLTHLKTPSVPTPRLADNFDTAMFFMKFVTDESSEDSLILPEDFIAELKHAGLL